MSDVQIVLGAYPRVRLACRPRGIRVAGAARALSAHQARILGHLDAKDPAMVTELAEFMRVTPSTMSLNLKRLEAGGFVVRERDPEDRRVMNVRLTQLGVAARSGREELDPSRVAAMLDRLRPDQRRRAVEGIAILAEAADALVARTDEYVGSLSGGGP